MKFETINAIEITEQTLVGSFGDFPRQRGNCFSVKADDGKSYRIVNFIVENLEEAIQRGVNFPIRIHPIAEGLAVIMEERIPHNWYQYRWCEVCCPGKLLPINQQHENYREVLSGKRTIHKGYMTTDLSKTVSL